MKTNTTSFGAIAVDLAVELILQKIEILESVTPEDIQGSVDMAIAIAGRITDSVRKAECDRFDKLISKHHV